MYSSRGLEIFQAWFSKSDVCSVAVIIKSLNGRDLIEWSAKNSRVIVDKLQICRRHWVNDRILECKELITANVVGSLSNRVPRDTTLTMQF